MWCDLHLCMRVIYNQPARCVAVPAAYTTDVYKDQCLYWASFKCVECSTWSLIFPCNILWLSVLLLCMRWWSFLSLSIQKFFLITKNYIITISQYWDECSNPSTAILFRDRILFRSIHSLVRQYQEKKKNENKPLRIYSVRFTFFNCKWVIRSSHGAARKCEG